MTRILRSASTGSREVQLVDEPINNPNRIVFGHIVIQALRKQGGLLAVVPFNETLHPALR
jgi:hypothetical protein